MQANTLRDYLQQVLETEKNVYILAGSLNRMNDYYQRLGQARPISQPKIQKVDDAVYEIIGGTILGAIVGLVIGFIYAWISSGSIFIGFFKALFSSWAKLGIGTGIGAVIGLIIYIFDVVVQNKKLMRSNKIANDNYANAILNDQNRISQELIVKNDVANYYSVTYNQYAQTKQALDILYSANIIHPQYRDIVAVASFYQYFDTGRCTMLEGHEGAYNLYESERRMNMIISQLSTVIQHLEDIKSNQYALYNAISAANNKIDILTHNSQLALSYASATAANSEIIAYNTQVTAQNTTALKWMEILKF